MLALQELDMRIRNLKLRLSMLPVEKEKLSSENIKEQEAMKEAKTKMQKTELEIKQIEAAIQKENSEILRFQGQSIMVKKNEEYKALMSEIEKCKTRISDIESKQIEAWDQLEKDKDIFKEHEKNFSERSKSIQSELKELDQLGTDLKEEIEKIKSGRSALQAKVDPEMLSDYTRLLNGKRGAPLVKVNQENCGNCHLKLTPQTINIARKGVMARCDNCSHMLYVDDTNGE